MRLLLALLACLIVRATCECEADLFFVLDVSGSMSDEQFESFRDMLFNVTATIDVTNHKHRVGLIRFWSHRFFARNKWEMRDFDYFTVNQLFSSTVIVSRSEYIAWRTCRRTNNCGKASAT